MSYTKRITKKVAKLDQEFEAFFREHMKLVSKLRYSESDKETKEHLADFKKSFAGKRNSYFTATRLNHYLRSATPA